MAMAALMLVHWLVARAVAQSDVLARLLDGSPIRLLTGGNVDEALRMRHCISRADLAEALHRKDYDRSVQAKSITFEPNGQINVL